MPTWNPLPANKTGSFSIDGLSAGSSYKVQLKIVNANGVTISNPYYKSTNYLSGGLTPSTPYANLTKVLTLESGDSAYLEGFNSTVWSGVVVVNNKVRGYYYNRTTAENFFIETSDMVNWSNPVKINLPNTGTGRLRVFYHNGWKGFGSSGEDMHILSSADGITWTDLGVAFSWKTDTIFSFFWDTNKSKYVAYGRVRGTTENGGWPVDQNPEIDRRGISFHSNDTWTPNWSNQGQIIMDPMDYWDYAQDLNPDFYSPNIFWDDNLNVYRGFVKVYWRDKTRVIQDYGDVPGETRITGPTYPIEFRSNDGITFTKFSDTPLAPLEAHERLGYDPPWTTGGSNVEPTCPACTEVGQLSMHGSEITFNGGTYRFYGYRDDIHYENPDYTELERSLYVYKISEDIPAESPVVYPEKPAALSTNYAGIWPTVGSYGAHYGNLSLGLSPGDAATLASSYPTDKIIINDSFTAPSVGGTVSQWRSKLESAKTAMEPYFDKIICYNLQDEPYTGANDEWTTPQIEELVEEAHKVFNTGSDVWRFSISISNSRSVFSNTVMPANIDYLILNWYPFYNNTTELNGSQSRFVSHLNGAINDLYNNNRVSPGTRLGITGQGFYFTWDNAPLVQPPDNSPSWYVDYIQNEPNGQYIDFLLYWKYGQSSGTTITLENLPTLWANMQSAYDSFIL